MKEPFWNKTGHFTSFIGRERRQIVQKWKKKPAKLLFFILAVVVVLALYFPALDTDWFIVLKPS